MTVYLILSRGSRADEATPILASSDPRVIDAALQAIAHLDDQEHESEYPLINCPTTVSGGEDDDEQRP